MIECEIQLWIGGAVVERQRLAFVRPPLAGEGLVLDDVSVEIASVEHRWDPFTGEPLLRIHAQPRPTPAVADMRRRELLIPDSSVATVYVPAQSVRNGRYPERTRPPVAIVLHTTGSGVLDRWGSERSDPRLRRDTPWGTAVYSVYANMKYGPHYVVGQEGQCAQVCPEDIVAWHVSSSGIRRYRKRRWGQGTCNWWRDRWPAFRSPAELANGELWAGGSCNENAIGIEVVAPRDNARGPWSDACRETLGRLVRDLASRHQIPVDPEFVLTHSDAHPLDRTTDSGRPWDPGPRQWVGPDAVTRLRADGPTSATASPSARGRKLENWSRSRRWDVAQLEEPANVAALRQLVRDAAADGRQVRPLGMRYSFSGVVVGDDLAVDLKHLDAVQLATPGDGRALTAALTDLAFDAPRVAGLALVQGGARIHAICEALRDSGEGLSPFALGGSSGQTLVGAFSTSTHGAAFGEHPLPEHIDAVHLLTGDRDLWVERSLPQKPLTVDAELKKLLDVPDLEIIRDTEKLRSLVVSLGAAGVIAGALVRLRAPRKRMNERLWPNAIDLDELLKSIQSHSCFERAPGIDPGWLSSASYRYFEALLNPYTDPPSAWICTRHELDIGPDEPIAVTRTNPNLVDFGLLVGTNAVQYTNALWTLLQASRLTGLDTQGNPAAYPYLDVMDVGVPSSQPVFSYELVWPLRPPDEPNDVVAFLGWVVERIRENRDHNRPFFGLISVRFSLGTSAHLGMQYSETPSEHRFAHVEISPLQRVGSRRRVLHPNNLWLMNQISASRFARNCRLHWGQGEHGQLAFDLGAYPKNQLWKNHVREFLGAHPDTFTSDFLRRLDGMA